jgi:hypothetical protein
MQRTRLGYSRIRLLWRLDLRPLAKAADVPRHFSAAIFLIAAGGRTPASARRCFPGVHTIHALPFIKTGSFVHIAGMMFRIDLPPALPGRFIAVTVRGVARPALCAAFFKLMSSIAGSVNRWPDPIS